MARDPCASMQPELTGRRVLVSGAGSGIGEWVCFCMSSRAAFITGQRVCANGGCTAR